APAASELVYAASILEGLDEGGVAAVVASLIDLCRPRGQAEPQQLEPIRPASGGSSRVHNISDRAPWQNRAREDRSNDRGHDRRMDRSDDRGMQRVDDRRMPRIEGRRTPRIEDRRMQRPDDRSAARIDDRRTERNDDRSSDRSRREQGNHPADRAYAGGRGDGREYRGE